VSLGPRPDAVQVLGKELRRDAERARRELAARSAGAALLFRRHGCAVLTLEAPLRGQADAGSAIVARLLRAHGVPDAAIEVAEESRSTREEIMALATRVRVRRWGHVLVLTSAYHVARSQRICDDVLGSGLARVLAPEALLAGAAPALAATIRAGVPVGAALARERAVERRLAVLAALLRPLPRRLRFGLEVAAGAAARGVDRRRGGLLRREG
jgi:hypothetical protein